MANKKIYVGTINIAMHAPHSVDRYIDLINLSFTSKRTVNIGMHGALIGALHPINKDSLEEGFTGELYRFVKLNSNEPWFNIESNEEASDDEIKEIKIPDKLKPHLTRFPFVFFPQGHRIYIETKNDGKSISLQKAAEIFKNIFTNDNLQNKFGQIEVTVEPDKNAIDEIFNIYHLRKIIIELVRPNPDDHSEAEKIFLDRLEKQNVGKMNVTLTSTHNDSIQPDNDTKILAEVAASNGYVQAAGKDVNNKSVSLSTKDKPWIECILYDTKQQSHIKTLIDIAKKMHKSFNE